MKCGNCDSAIKEKNWGECPHCGWFNHIKMKASGRIKQVIAHPPDSKEAMSHMSMSGTVSLVSRPP